MMPSPKRCWRLAAVLTLLVSSSAAEAQQAFDPGQFRSQIRSYRGAQELEILRELADLLAIPNVASDRVTIRRNADLVVKMLERRGLKARLLEAGDGPPAVYGELAAPGATRTVVFYAHYDGQPVNPSQWASSPWRPTLRDARLEDGGREIAWDDVRPPVPGEWRLYARSASDDKSPIVAMLVALDALRASNLPVSVNLKFFLEGEEEAGSPHLGEMVGKHRDLLEADAWILGDGPVHQTRRMLVYFGARGVQGLEITVYGPARALHSGHYGNWAPNPAAMLASLIASMRDSEGRVLMKGFYDSVRPPTATETQAIADAPDVGATLREELALGPSEGGEERVEEGIIWPALNVRGLEAGGVGEHATNSIPPLAQGSIDFRLVPDLTPERVREITETHVRAQGYHVVHSEPDMKTRAAHPRVAWLMWDAGYPAYRTDMDVPASRAVIRVVQEMADAPVVRLPTLGGSLPMHYLAGLAPLVGVPIVNHDNGQHAPNENLRLQNLWDGIEVYAALLARLGPAWDAAGAAGK